MSGLWRKFVFGWKLDGPLRLLSSYPTKEGHVATYRYVLTRVAKLAPFLTLNDDPYIAAVDDRLYWIVDGYITSRKRQFAEAVGHLERLATALAGLDQ